MADKLSVYRPTGPALSAPRVMVSDVSRSWDDLRFALIDNSKPGAAALLTGIADSLMIPEDRRVMIAKQVAPVPLSDEERTAVKELCDVAILAVGNCGSCCSWTCHDAVTLASELGMPSVLIVTTPFEQIAGQVASSLGYPELPVIPVEHPVGLLPFDLVRARGANVGSAVRDAILSAGSAAASYAKEASDDELLVVESDQTAIDDLYQENWWSDGLPVVPPTEQRVAAMLGRHASRADEVIGKVATGYGLATYRSIAVNAVLAGCRPAYFDTVVAAVKAVIDPAFNLHGIQATTHPAGPMIMVNGPIVDRIGMNAGSNTFGPGNRANASIGRALSLCIRNIGLAIPGGLDATTLGHPGKYSYCFTESSASPWPHFHADRGFAAEESTVTVYAADAPLCLCDYGRTAAEELLLTIAESVAVPGTYNAFFREDLWLVMAPEHAEIIDSDGWSKADVCRFMYEHARLPTATLRHRGLYGFADRSVRRAWLDQADDMVPIVDSPDRVNIAVAGGPYGGYTAVIFGSGISVTRLVAEH